MHDNDITLIVSPTCEIKQITTKKAAFLLKEGTNVMPQLKNQLNKEMYTVCKTLQHLHVLKMFCMIIYWISCSIKL